MCLQESILLYCVDVDAWIDNPPICMVKPYQWVVLSIKPES